MEKQTADRIITEYVQKVYGFAMKKAFSYEEAEDLCAEILQEVYQSLLRAEEIVNLEGYIWRISEHTYAKYVSRVKRQEGFSIDGIQLPFYDTYFFEASKEDILRLRREIAFLTQKRREIVYSFYYENKTVVAISKELGLSQGTVKWHLNKARNELKEGFSMKRGIGKLGILPIKAVDFGHSGQPGNNGGPEAYLRDKLNLNIVYSVYFTPKKKEEIAEELGVTLVFLEDRIEYLEENGFLVQKSDNRFTTYVKFQPRTFSMEAADKVMEKKQRVAEQLVKEYVPLVREAVADIKDIYIPGRNRELFEAAAIWYGISNKCAISAQRDLSKYMLKTTDGGEYIPFIALECKQSDPEYTSKYDYAAYQICGDMRRSSEKYPNISAWASDSKLCSREGFWQNNRGEDYEYLYEFICGELTDTLVNKEKFKRLQERRFLTKDNRVGVMVCKGTENDFYAKIPCMGEQLKKKFAEDALELAMLAARDYPPQMQDLVIDWGVQDFLSKMVPVMVMDILYENGTFRPLTEQERVTANLIMFSDVLPTET